MTWTWLGIATAAVLAFSCYTGYRNGFIREMVSMFFVVLAMIIVWAINPYVNTFLKENTPVYEKVREACGELVQGQYDVNAAGQDEQNEILDSLSMPGILKEGILRNNTADGYTYLAATSFEEYVADYLAIAVVNGISFLLSYLLASICINTINYALNIIAGLPVLKGVNKVAGIFMGGIKCIIFIWIILLVLTVLCNSELGKRGMELVEKDIFLNMLNTYNPFIKIFMSIFYGNT